MTKKLQNRYVYCQLCRAGVQRFKSNPIQGYFTKPNRPVGFSFWTCQTGWTAVWLEKSLRPSYERVFHNDSCVANHFRQRCRLKLMFTTMTFACQPKLGRGGGWFSGPVINRNDEDRNRVCAEPCALVSSAATPHHGHCQHSGRRFLLVTFSTNPA